MATARLSLFVNELYIMISFERTKKGRTIDSVYAWQQSFIQKVWIENVSMYPCIHELLYLKRQELSSTNFAPDFLDCYF